jgi:hypothetical protein
VGEKSETFTKAEATILANKIKAEFAPAGKPFSWRKGKELWTYIDQDKGYYFQLYIFDQTAAKSVITNVLQLRGHTPDWKKLNLSKNSEPSASYPIVPPTKTILGKPVKQQRLRPVGLVRFVAAVAHLYGLPEPLVLFDPDRRYKKSLVR